MREKLFNTKLTNTLRLRLAFRISNVEPDKAKQEAEKAVADGVMLGNSDNAMMDVATASRNGLNLMSPWSNFRMSASVESYLKGFNDPRLQVYYSPTLTDSGYHGLRNGLSITQLAGADTGGAGDYLSSPAAADIPRKNLVLSPSNSASKYSPKNDSSFSRWHRSLGRIAAHRLSNFVSCCQFRQS